MKLESLKNIGSEVGDCFVMRFKEKPTSLKPFRFLGFAQNGFFVFEYQSNPSALLHHPCKDPSFSL